MEKTTAHDEVISKLYYNAESGFGSIAKTHAAAKRIDPSIKREHVKAFLDKQEIRQTKKRRGDNSFVPFAPLEEFQLDLFFEETATKVSAATKGLYNAEAYLKASRCRQNNWRLGKPHLVNGSTVTERILLFEWNCLRSGAGISLRLLWSFLR